MPELRRVLRLMAGLLTTLMQPAPSLSCGLLMLLVGELMAVLRLMSGLLTMVTISSSSVAPPAPPGAPLPPAAEGELMAVDGELTRVLRSMSDGLTMVMPRRGGG